MLESSFLNAQDVSVFLILYVLLSGKSYLPFEAGSYISTKAIPEVAHSCSPLMTLLSSLYQLAILSICSAHVYACYM